MTEYVQQVPKTNPDQRKDLLRQLSELIPEVVVDGKVDGAMLENLLGNDYGDDSERFGLFWPGKKRALRAAQTPTTATLKPLPSESKDWDESKNVFIEGDNLEVLKILQKRYHNQVKLIYIDPPYNTGNDFIYPDNYKEGLQSYLEFTRQTDEGGRRLSTNSESDGRYHSNWLNMMYPRLKLARNLLSDDGVIAISIDDNEISRLTLLCDEVFGADNFVAVVIVQANKGGRDYLPLAQTHEYLVIYARSYANVGIYDLPKDDSALPLVDERGRYEVRELRNRNPRFNRANRPNLYYPFYLDPSNVDQNGYASVSLNTDDRHTVETFPTNSQGVDGCWRWGKTKANENIVAEDPFFSQVVAKQVKSGGWNIYEKNRRSTQKAKTIWDETEVRTEAGTREVRLLFGASVFDHPKPVDLIGKLIAISTSPDGNDLVLDFFSGSASTAHAVMQANAKDGGNRRHVQVQLPEPTIDGSEAREQGYKTIAEIGRKRIDLAGEQIKNQLESLIPVREHPIDIGYRAYRLIDTNFFKWNVSSDVGEERLHQQLLEMRNSSEESASPDELLTEVLLKLGYSLSERISEIEISGLSLRSVDDSVLLAYLDEHTKPTRSQLQSVVDLNPGRIVILEDAFHGDDELKTNLAQMCKSRNIELWTA